jgi:hypothetical protein
MKNGTTLVEFMIIIAVVGIIAILTGGEIVNKWVNNRSATEVRAAEGAGKYISKNGLQVQRFSCAGDSNGDGYGTCNLVLKDGEKIIINCPTDYLDVELWGAEGCKEVFQNFNIGMGAGEAFPPGGVE